MSAMSAMCAEHTNYVETAFASLESRIDELKKSAATLTETNELLETKLALKETNEAMLMEKNESLEKQLNLMETKAVYARLDAEALLAKLDAKRAAPHPRSMGILLMEGLAERKRAEETEQARAQAGSGKRARNLLENPHSNESQAERSVKRANRAASKRPATKQANANALDPEGDNGMGYRGISPSTHAPMPTFPGF